MSIAFVGCVERGRLEGQTVLLCRSIRRFAGRYRDAPVHTFQPRRGTEISHATRAALDELGVEHHTETLNTEFADYGYGNKIFVSAWAEEHLREDVLVFLDSDTVFTGEPADLDLPPGSDAAARPAFSGFLNSAGPGDLMDAYWMKLYDICGVEGEPFVVNELGRRVRAYFSSGLVAVRRTAGLFARWKSTFLRLVALRHIPDSTGISRMDEVSLAAVLSQSFGGLRLLDDRYNYLIFKRPRLASPWREAQLEELVHVHYRSSFSKPDFLRLVEPPLDPAGEVVRWLEQYLPLEGINDAPLQKGC